MDYKIFKLILLNHNGEIKETHDYSSKIDSSKSSNKHSVQIYGDDTIENVKYKLCSFLEDTNIEKYSFHYKTSEDFEPKTKFMKLSKGTHYISKENFQIFCLNRNIEFDDSKDEYNFDDFFEVFKRLTDKGEYSVTKSLDIYSLNEICIYNPFENLYNIVFNADYEKINSRLFFEIGNIEENTIFAIHQSEYEIFADKHNLNQSKLVPFYYPYLNKKNQILDDKYAEYNELISNHAELFKKCKLEEKKKQIIGKSEINSFEFMYKNTKSFLFPLEIFFKKVHSTIDIPLIQYKLDSHSETIYRLFCNKIDFIGKKRPFLSKDKVTRISKKFKRKNCISFCYYIQSDRRLKNTSIYISIDNTGNIYVLIENIKSESDVKDICLSKLNETIGLIIKLIDPARLMYNQIETLDSENIEILELSYIININPYDRTIIKKACKYYFQSIFQTNASGSDLVLTYKRVSNYNKMDDMNAVVVKMLNKNEDTVAIIQKLKFYFKNDEELAREELMKIYSQLRISDHLEKDGEKKRKIHIHSNPGLFIHFEGGGKDSKIIIENLNSFEGINYVEKFLKNLIYITTIIENKEKRKKIDTTYFNKTENSPILSTVAPQVETTASVTIENAPNQFSNVENRPDVLKLYQNDDDNNFYKQLNNYSNIGENDEQELEEKEEEEDNFPNLINGQHFSNKKSASQESFSSKRSNSSLKKNQSKTPNSLSKVVDEGDPINYNENHQTVAESIRPQENVLNTTPSRTINNKSVSAAQETDDEEESDDENSSRFMDGWADPKTPPNEEEDNKSVGAVAETSDEEDEEEQEEDNKSVGAVAETSDEEDEEEQEEEDNKSVGAVAETSDEEEEQEEEDNKSVGAAAETSDEEDSKSLGAVAETSDEEEEEQHDYQNRSTTLIGGGKLSLHPNPFVKLITDEYSKPDSGALWYNQSDDKIHSSYSKQCAWSGRKIPILLTENEKNNIMKNPELKKYYDDPNNIIKYSTSANKNLYYICPPYWNIKDNMPILDKSKINKENLITKKDKKSVDDSKQFIFKLDDPNEKQYPGFFNSSKHKHGLFIPCCFTNPKGAAFMTRKKDAEKQMKEIQDRNLTSEEEIIAYLEGEKEKSKSKKVESVQKEDKNILYKQPGKLDQNKFGFVPPHLESFLNVSNVNCNKNNAMPCLLRKGAEHDTQKSFLGAIALLFLNNPSIKNMISHIKEKLTLDNILEFHEGNIPYLFYDDAQLEKVDIQKYSSTLIYQNFMKMPDRNIQQLQVIINGYENFIEFIEKDGEYIDSYYLWDIVSSGLINKNNPDIPLNLIIIKESLESEHLSIVCPSPGFSIQQINPKQQTIILYNKRNIFEPIMLRDKSAQNWKTRIKATGFFDETNYTFIEQLLKKTFNDIITKCLFQEKMHYSINLFEFKDFDLFSSKYSIVRQIINIRNKVSGIEVIENKTNTKFFVPLKNSGIQKDIPYDFYIEEIWTDYKTTKDNLKRINMYSKTKLNCNVLKKVIQSDMIIGFMTKSNYFIKINPPIHKDSITDTLDSIDYYDLYELDADIFYEYELRDKDRKTILRNLQLEKQFYNAFLNTIRYQLQKYENFQIKGDIKTIIQNKSHEEFESHQLKLYEILDKWCENYFVFFKYNKGTLQNLTDITICNDFDDDDEQPFCSKLQLNDEKNKLLIPDVNLYTNENNRIRYISLLTNELLLNKTIQKKLLQNSYGYFFDDFIYRVKKNEIILLEKILKQYYESLHEQNKSKYIKHSAYENIKPYEVQEYLDRTEINAASDSEDSEEDSDEEEESSPTKNKTPTQEEEEEEEEEEEPPTKNKTPMQEEENFDIQPKLNYNADVDESQKSIDKNKLNNIELELNSVSNNNEEQLNNDENTFLPNTKLQISNENKEIPNKIKQIFVEKSVKLPEPPKLIKVVKSSQKNIKLEKIKGKQLQENQCVKYVRSLPKKWQKFFIKETTEFNFTTLNENCNNFLLILFILQVHHLNLYKDLNIKSLKVLLTHFYNEYIQENSANKIKIANKWTNQNKASFSKQLLNNEDIGTIIQNETYTLTEIDIFLIAYKTKTPIIVYKQSKKSIKTLRLITKEDEKHYYFIRIGQKNNLNLNNFKRNTLISIDERLSDRMIEEINKNIIQTFDDYLYL